nr:dynamin family protein [Rhodospirillales bacterium]
MSGSVIDLLRRIDGFARDVRARDLAPEEVLRPLDEALAAARATGIERPVDALLVLMLCGPTAVGKSSLLNALAGATIAPEGLGATTAAPLVYLHEDDDPARLFAYGQTLGELARSTPQVVRHARPELRHKLIIDTPDIDSAVRAHRATTEAAASGADVVLYVTSPEKYKVEEPLRWLAQHRRRHGIGFVLNKWDADGMGRQFGQRDRVAADFRDLVARFGFPDPILFFVSAHDAPGSEGAQGLASLQAWITQRLDAATAIAVAARARRAGWGELAAAIDAVRAGLAGSQDDVREVARRWADAVAAATGLAQAEAARLAAVAAPSVHRPQFPGLLGVALPALRRLPSWPSPQALPAPDAPAGGAFGAAALAELHAAARDLELLARTKRLRPGGVIAGWDDMLARTAEDLALLPGRVEADAVARTLRARIRRAVARLWLGAAELAIACVLGLTLWRLVSDFVVGRYAPLSLLGSAAAIVALVALFAQAGVRLLFPALSARIAAGVRQRAGLRLQAAGEALTGLFAEQVEASQRLRDTGTTLLAAIDRETGLLAAQAAEDETAARLFAQPSQ